MKRSWLVMAVTLLGLGALPVLGDPIAVGGRIVDPKGSPVRGASVALVPIVSRFAQGELELEGQGSPEPVARTASGADGRFEVAAPAPGMWAVQVNAPGFARRSLFLTPLLEPEELPRLQLDAETPVRVRVVDPRGRPVAGARVQAMDATWSVGTRWWARRQLAVTGADGTAVLARGEQGPEEARVVTAGHPPASVRLEAGQKEAEVRLAAACPRTVQVTSPSAAGGSQPVAGAQVRHLGSLLGATDEAGRLSVPAPCDADLRLSAEARDGRWTDATVPRRAKPAAADAAPLGIALPRQPVRLSGRVQENEVRTPVAGALVWPVADPAAYVRTDARGTYTLTLTSGGQHTPVAANASGYLEDVQPARAGEPGPTLSLRPAATAVGVVVDEAGRPVADAEVVLAITEPQVGDWAPPDSGRSDAQGRFRLRSVAGKALTLTARHPDYVAAELSLPAVAPRGSRSGLRIVLARGLSAAGRVLGPAGQPIAGAEVWLAHAMDEPWDPDEQPATAVTGADGRFTLHRLKPGRADLTAKARGFAPTRVPGLEIPDGPETADLGTVTLAPGATLRGVVVDPRDEPVAGAEVSVRGLSGHIPWGSGPAGAEETRTAADGTFSIADLSPGAQVRLEISKQGYVRNELQSLDVPRDEPLRIVLTPGSRIAGRVVDEAGEPVRAAMVRLFRPVVEGGAGLPGSTLLEGRGSSGSGGTFEIDGVPAGKVRVVASHPSFLDGEIPALDVVAGRDVENLELVLRRGAVVTGRVTGADGEPLESAWVRPARSAAGDYPTFKGARADAEGRYRIEGLAEGLQSFQAEGPELQPQVRELQVRPGENRLDFRLAAGHEISGRVLDAAGAPVAGARVHLTPPGSAALSSMPGHHRLGTQTGADGSFRIEGAVTGVYDLQAAKEGYAPGRLAQVEVARPVQGLELRLDAGGSIRGRLTGVDLADLASVSISAHPTGSSLPRVSTSGRPDYQGAYRIENLAAGEYRVFARASGNRRADGKVTVPTGGEAVLDLDLTEKGLLTLTGRVLRRGEPLPNATVAVWGDSGSHGSDQTGPEGTFRIPGLAPGSYSMRAVLADTHVEHRGTLELSGDRDIVVEISGHRLSGRVIDATSQSPLARARVTVEPAVTGPGLPYSPPRGGGSDEKGAFTFTDLAPGRYRLQAQVDGYAVAETTVELTDGGGGLDGVELALQPTEGLTLEVRGALGSPPPAARIALLDAAGRVVLAQEHPTGENGRVRITSAPPGTWQLLVAGTGYATLEQTVRVPGPTVNVTLPRASTLTVSAPGLPAGGRVTITGAGGQPLRLLAWGEDVEQHWYLRDGPLVLEGVPPGRWQVRVTAPDGQAWEAAVTAVAGNPVRVVVR